MGARGLKQRESFLAELADRQFGLLRHADLMAAGLTRHDIAARIQARRLARLHHLVYAFGHTALRDEGRWLAALWACGDAAVLSHGSASAYNGWSVEDPGAPVHVTTTGTIRTRPGIVVHRVCRLDRVDVFRRHPFAVTTIPRTFVDLADVLTWREFRAVADAQASLRLDSIAAAQRRAGRRVGRGRVTRLIQADDAHTKSEFERRYLRFARAQGVPRPHGLNVKVAGHRADCLYAAERLVVELDGRAFHARRAQMRADRLRDTRYQVAGYLILRLVWDDLHPDEAAATAARVTALLGAWAQRET